MNAFEQGFTDKCAEYGVDPGVLVKFAQALPSQMEAGLNRFGMDMPNMRPLAPDSFTRSTDRWKRLEDQGRLPLGTDGPVVDPEWRKVQLANARDYITSNNMLSAPADVSRSYVAPAGGSLPNQLEAGYMRRPPADNSLLRRIDQYVGRDLGYDFKPGLQNVIPDSKVLQGARSAVLAREAAESGTKAGGGMLRRILRRVLTRGK